MKTEITERTVKRNDGGGEVRVANRCLQTYDDILNFYNNRSSNAAAESFNAKVKSFRAALRGIRDEKFFLYRLSMIYAYPH
ncbi:transposase [Prevotella sp. P4-119]|uniref:transposase n=1 Tax=Prevotella sp. P4-119 TaxID=2024218 RepID=UPI00352C223C